MAIFLHFSWNKADNFPDRSLEEASNYCRNPDDSPKGPWCFQATKPTVWRYCDVHIPKCGKFY